MADDLNEIPKTGRRSMFTIAAWFNGGVASLLLVLFLRCMNSRLDESNALWNERLNDMKQQMEQTGTKKIQEADRKITPVIDETQRMVDSLTNRLDSLKAKKS